MERRTASAMARWRERRQRSRPGAAALSRRSAAADAADGAAADGATPSRPRFFGAGLEAATEGREPSALERWQERRRRARLRSSSGPASGRLDEAPAGTPASAEPLPAVPDSAPPPVTAPAPLPPAAVPSSRWRVDSDAGGAVRASLKGRAVSAMARWHQRRCRASSRLVPADAVPEGALLADLSAEVWHDALRLGPALLLCGVGIALTYGVCVPVEGAPERLYWRRQIAFLGLGLAAYAVIAKGVFPWSRRLTMRVLYGLCCVVLPVLVLVLGRATGNSTRWLSIAGLPAVQPAEFAKIVLLWVVAEMVNPDPRLDRAMRLRRHLLAVAAVALPVLLVFLERSMGNTALLCASVGTVLLTRWFSWPSLLILATAGIVGLTPVAMAIHRIRVPEPAVNVARLEARRGSFGPDGPPVGLSVREVKSVVAPSGAAGLLSHCPDRFACYLSQYGGWNARQALRCVRIGGEHGSGYRQGNITILGYLPRTVQHTDFIYCVLSESFGLWGAALVLGLIGLLIAVVLWRGAVSPHPAAGSFAIGFATLIFLQTVIHVGMALRLVPIIGIPLPFVSYGGSFLVTSFAALGLVARYDGPAGMLAATAGGARMPGT